jgi:hypothetical protein
MFEDLEPEITKEDLEEHCNNLEELLREAKQIILDERNARKIIFRDATDAIKRLKKAAHTIKNYRDNKGQLDTDDFNFDEEIESIMDFEDVDVQVTDLEEDNIDETI